MAEGSTPARDNPRALIVGDVVFYGLDVASLGELPRNARMRAERLVAAADPAASLIGAIVGSHPWDIRPIVVHDTPSIIRIFPPEVGAATSVHQSVASSLRLLVSRGQLLHVGEIDGQLWSQRTLAVRTVGEQMEDAEPLRLRITADLVLRAARELERSSAEGLVHGHVCAENFVLNARGEVTLVDHLYRGAGVEALYQLGRELPARNREGLAPELLQGIPATPEGDIFGLGMVMRDLFRRSEVDETKLMRTAGSTFGWPKEIFPKEAAIPLRELLFAMTSSDPALRPRLDQVIRLVEEVKRHFGSVSKLDEDLAAVQAAPARQVVRVGATRQPSAKEASFLDVSRTRIRTRAQPAVPVQAPAVPAQGRDRQITSFLLLFALLGVIGILFYLSPYRSASNTLMSDQDLRVAWESGIPSRMGVVAAAALDIENPSVGARSLIIKSALEGNLRGGIVDTTLLRIAFHKQWEIELTPTDRQAALTLALGKIVDEQDLKFDLQSLHPGVLLGITVSKGGRVSGILSKVSAAAFTRLPAPFNLAFSQLLAMNPNATLGDEVTQALARIGVKARIGVGGAVTNNEIISYLTQGGEVRLRALAAILSFDNDQARRALLLVLSTPETASEATAWAKAAELPNWRSIGGSDQLFILSGLAPGEAVTDDELLLLARHPSPEMRRYIAERALGSSTYTHPGKVAVFQLIRANPSLLTPEQMFGLMRILRAPAAVALSSIYKWTESSPPFAVAEALLVATANGAEATNTDFAVSQYLREIGWNPTFENLKLLVSHPDRATRFYAYTKLFDLRSSPHSAESLEILRAAQKRETDQDYLKQLRLMIRALELKK